MVSKYSWSCSSHPVSQRSGKPSEQSKTEQVEELTKLQLDVSTGMPLDNSKKAVWGSTVTPWVFIDWMILAVGLDGISFLIHRLCRRWILSKIMFWSYIFLFNWHDRYFTTYRPSKDLKGLTFSGFMFKKIWYDLLMLW